MKRNSKRNASPSHDVGTGNVYADLGIDDPEGMLVKAQLVAKITEILGERVRDITPKGAASSDIVQRELVLERVGSAEPRAL